MTEKTFIIIAVAAAASALCVWLLWTIGRSPKGQKAKVTRILKQYSGIRSYKVISDITLKDGNKSVHVDNILVGFFGIILINSQVERDADYYGDEKDEQWSVVKKDVKTRFRNPLIDGASAMEIIRKDFAKKNIYRIQMEQLVVFTASFNKTGLYIKDTLPIVNVRKLHSFLSKTRFDKDNNVDVEQITEIINAMRA